MRDTEPMSAVRRPGAAQPPPATDRSAPRAHAIRQRANVLAACAALIAVAALLACAYLHGEVVTLRAEIRESRLAARAAERAADRATLEAQNARSALANAEPVETPEPPDPNAGE